MDELVVVDCAHLRQIRMSMQLKRLVHYWTTINGKHDQWITG